jgi:hypothetical protein
MGGTRSDEGPVSERPANENTDWIAVGRLAAGFGAAAGSCCLSPSAELAGRRIALSFEDGSAVAFHFRTASELLRIPTGGRDEGTPPDTYRATEIRPGIFFVDLLDPVSPTASVSLVLDLGRSICTALAGSLPSAATANEPLLKRIGRRRDLTGVEATLLSGAVSTPFLATTERHSATRELIGKRVEYTYSDTERYEHIYLNERFYTWHCLAGSERGLADTDRCEYRKLAERLYLFVWREKIVPTLGAVLVDLDQMKTTGKIFGYRSFDFGEIVNFPIGARVRVLGAV